MPETTTNNPGGKAGQAAVSVPATPVTSKLTEDIFADTENSASRPSGRNFYDQSDAKPIHLAPKTDNSPSPSELIHQEDAVASEKRMVRFLVSSMVLIVVLGGGGVGYLAYKKLAARPTGAKPAVEQTVKPDSAALEAKNASAPKTGKSTEVASIDPGRSTGTPATADPDADSDGLSDKEEASLNTNANETDTDGDSLSDREEYRVYHTDPLNPDSDGDGYSDGKEIKGGFNPNGPGKLMDIKKYLKTGQ